MIIKKLFKGEPEKAILAVYKNQDGNIFITINYEDIDYPASWICLDIEEAKLFRDNLTDEINIL